MKLVLVKEFDDGTSTSLANALACGYYVKYGVNYIHRSAEGQHFLYNPRTNDHAVIPAVCGPDVSWALIYREEVMWYESYNFGVTGEYPILCYVSDSPRDLGVTGDCDVDMISGYDARAHINGRFEGRGVYWVYAVPVPSAEISKFFDRALSMEQQVV